MNDLYDLMAAVGTIARKLLPQAAPLMTGTELIACECAVSSWAPGSYELDAVRVHKEQVWRCCQAHDSTENTDWQPGETPALWTPCHTTDPVKAKPYLAPAGAHDAYQAGECALWTDGKVYRCTVDATVHDPGTRPEAWEKI